MRRSNTFWSFLLFSAVLLSSTRSQTDDADQLQEAYEEARIKNEELTQSLNLSELKVLQLNKTLEANKQQGSTYSDLQNCPINIGTNSTCKKIRGMGCYCIVEVLKSYSDAADYCERNNMKLVAIETREEWDLLRGFLTDNLGSREKYDTGFWTSGIDENSDGRWQWTSSKQPLLFRNWDWYIHNEEWNRLLIKRQKPFAWYNGRIKYIHGLLNEYFICESSAPEQEIKQLVAYGNAKDCPHSIGTNSTCVYLDPDGCYCVVLTESNRIEGSRHCKSQGMELVSIETEAENSQIAAFLFEQHQPSNCLVQRRRPVLNQKNENPVREIFPESCKTWSFWTSALYNEKKRQFVWTATGQFVDYAKWEDGQPQLNWGDGHAIMLRRKMRDWVVEYTSSNKIDSTAHYICEKNTFINGSRNSQMKQKSCSAGSDWTCFNEVTGCYCHQTIKRNWTDASALCESIGMNLVSIETAQEQLLVASGLTKLEGTGFWWTSGSDSSEDLWTWTATGRDLNYTNWAVDEPNKLDNSKHGVAVIGYSDQAKWVVYPVTREHFPICGK